MLTFRSDPGWVCRIVPKVCFFFQTNRFNAPSASRLLADRRFPTVCAHMYEKSLVGKQAMENCILKVADKEIKQFFKVQVSVSNPLYL